jgi:hypothetical protein
MALEIQEQAHICGGVKCVNVIPILSLDEGRFVKQGVCRSSRYGHLSCLIECGSRENRYYATGDCRSYVWCYYGRKFDFRCPAGTVSISKSRVNLFTIHIGLSP